ncbi:glycosyltransferase, partial [Pedobacter sp.]|uniref:glycosyltransferase n=1 Tax=Pedobacter sp. TaxID=1411316 RepID=UPI003D7F4260
MITVLQITPAYKPAYIYGGPTLSVANLCEELQQSAFKIIVLTTTANGKTELPVAPNVATTVANVEVHYCKRIAKDPIHLSPALLLKLISQIRQHKRIGPNNCIVHIHSWWNTIAVMSCCIAMWYRVPVVLSPRGMLTTYSMN